MWNRCSTPQPQEGTEGPGCQPIAWLIGKSKKKAREEIRDCKSSMLMSIGDITVVKSLLGYKGLETVYVQQELKPTMTSGLSHLLCRSLARAFNIIAAIETPKKTSVGCCNLYANAAESCDPWNV